MDYTNEQIFGHPKEQDKYLAVPFWLAEAIKEGSVCGVHPEEAPSIVISHRKNGWSAIAYSGDGSKPGSVSAAAGGFATAQEAFSYIIGATKEK